jgi:hypothetical protein
MAAITNNTTFNKNNNNGQFPGFYSRVLFSYAPYLNEVPELLQNNTSDWVVDSGYDGIGELLSGNAPLCHGSNILPAYYWRPGKTIRVTGDFSVNIPLQEGLFQNKILNLRFGLIETATPAATSLAIQNNNNNHGLAFSVGTGGSAYDYIPIHFECNIICSTINQANDPPCTFYSNGFYYYDHSNYNSAGTNYDKSAVYVPVWKSANGSTTLGDEYYSASTKIMMNIYGSEIGNGADGYGAVYLTKLLIEELA